MSSHDIIVIGASAGGVDALPRLIGSLPSNLPASVFVVLHISPHGPDLLPELIRRMSSLLVAHGVDGEVIQRGRVYVAPPDHHLQVEGRRVRLMRGPKENFHRPSIDTLFRSAAQTYGARVVAVVLTGSLDDGTAGLHAVKRHGGITIVQDPKDAQVPAMPESALRHVRVDHCVPLAKMGALILRLATTRNVPRNKPLKASRDRRELRPRAMENQFGRPTSFVCPECNGPLWETKSGSSLQFRCHVGHSYSPGSLLADHANSLERALWTAVRTFDEGANLLRRMAARENPSGASTKLWNAKAKEQETHAQIIRKLLQAPHNNFQ